MRNGGTEIKMGLFGFNYDTPGPGVPDNLPPKKGVGLFFDILFRKISKLVGINILYALCSLPVFAVYFFLSTIHLNPILPAIEESGVSVFVLCMAIGILLMLLLGGGVLTPGFVYVLRCFVRGEHAFVASDFFEHVKKNLKQSIPVMLIDFAFVFLMLVNFNIIRQVPSLGVFRIPLYAIAVIYSMVRMYLYILMVTFEAPLWKIYKYSLALSLYRLPQNLCILALTVGLYVLMALYLPYPIVMFAIAPLILYSFMWTMQMVYTYSVVEKTLDLGKPEEKPERIFED